MTDRNNGAADAWRDLDRLANLLPSALGTANEAERTVDELQRLARELQAGGDRRGR
jgi:hypothetical protein